MSVTPRLAAWACGDPSLSPMTPAATATATTRPRQGLGCSFDFEGRGRGPDCIRVVIVGFQAWGVGVDAPLGSEGAMPRWSAGMA